MRATAVSDDISRRRLNKIGQDCSLDLKKSKAYIASSCVTSCPAVDSSSSYSSTSTMSERKEYEKLFDKLFADKKPNSILDSNIFLGQFKPQDKGKKYDGKEEFVKIMERKTEDRAALVTERDQYHGKLKKTLKELQVCTNRQRIDAQAIADAKFMKKINANARAQSSETSAETEAILDAQDKSILSQIHELDSLREVLFESLHKSLT